MSDWESYLDPGNATAEPTPEHLALRARFGAPSAQRYSEVLLHCVLCVLPVTAFGEIAVVDAWTEGEWSITVVFRQLGIDRAIGVRESVVSTHSKSTIRFIGVDGVAQPFPPEPMVVASRLADWMTEPLGTEVTTLDVGDDGILWAGIDPADPDPPIDDFTRKLTAGELVALGSRVGELDGQLAALDSGQLPAALRLVPERLRDVDRDRLRRERSRLAAAMAQASG